MGSLEWDLKKSSNTAFYGVARFFYFLCIANWFTTEFPIDISASGLPRCVLRLPRRWCWITPTSVMTSFLPSVASLPVPISTVCSKRKKAALLRLGERKTVKKYVLGVSFPHEGDTFFVWMRHHCGGMRHLVSKKNTIFAPWKCVLRQNEVW